MVRQNDNRLRHRPSPIVRDDQRLILTGTRRPDGRHSVPLDQTLVRSLLNEAESRNWRLLNYGLVEGVLTADEPPAGAIVTFLPTDPRAIDLRDIGCPMVRIGRLPHPEDAKVPCVLPDVAAAARMAAHYLLDRGFEDMALIGHRQSEMTPLMEESLRQVADESGFRLHPHHFSNFPEGATRAYQFAQRSAKLTAYLADLPKPVGLLAYNSTVAGTVSVMCRQAGLGVPEDVAILALDDNLENCEMGPVPLSAVDVNQLDIGKAAADVLARLIEGEKVPEITLVSPRGVITRRSTDIVAVDDPTVARAVRFIWDHLERPLSVDQVADAVQTPRYKLERLFRQYLDRGVYEEVRRARLERFCHLLKTTNDTIGTLAPKVGYQSVNRLHHAFQKEFGITPRHYRLKARDGKSDDGDE